MNKFVKIILNVCIISSLFISCNHNVIKKHADNTRLSKVCFACETTENYSRKAIAEVVFNDASYTYDLTATEQGKSAKVSLLNKVGYSSLSSGIEIRPAVYTFELTAYKNNVKVMTGKSENVDLTSAYQYVEFVMFPVTGGKGSAEIKLVLPADMLIDSVDTCLTTPTAPFTVTENNRIYIYSNDFKRVVNGTHSNYEMTLSYPELSSGVDIFSYIRIKDVSGAVIASRLEAIEVLPGEVSKSTVEINDLRTYATALDIKIDGVLNGKVDGEIEVVKGKELILEKTEADGTKISYILSNNGAGTFSGVVTSGTYEVYVATKGDETLRLDTGLDYTIGSSSSVNEINFVSVKFPGDKGIKIDSITGAIPVDVDDNGAPAVNENGYYIFLVPQGTKLDFDVSFSKGYEKDGSHNVVIDGNIINPADPDNNTVTIENVQTKKEITEVTGIKPVVYTISYDLADAGATWTKSESTFAHEYTVEDEITLPVYTDVNLSNKMLDGWEDENIGRLAKIHKGTTGNLELKAVWKDINIVVEQPQGGVTPEWKNEDIKNPENFTKSPTVFACGYSIVVEWSGDGTGETRLFMDLNSDGIKDSDEPIVGAYRKAQDDYNGTDFTGYKLEASNPDSSMPASDFKFTIKGGKLASVKGLGHNANNISEVNISGKNTVIGNGQVLETSERVGIDLESFTNEVINITDEMSGDYNITMESRNKFSPRRQTVIANIYKNKDGKEYALVSNFKCIYKTTKEELSFASLNSGNPTLLYLKNPNAITIITKDQITPGTAGGIEVGTWKDEAAGTYIDFTLGGTADISVPCSVFSVSVKNGTFQLKEGYTKLKKETGEELKTIDLALISASSWNDNGTNGNIVAGKDYIYLHMLSEENMITAERATEFLKNMVFIKANPDELEDTSKMIEININLETVDYESEILPLKNRYGKAFDYYNGSFYLGMDTSTSKIGWNTAYDKAKNITFNGLQGYLTCITSHVENEYITGKMGVGVAWIGGSRIYPKDGKYDENTYSSDDLKNTNNNNSSYWYWQCGPDAGRLFWQGTNNATSGDVGEYVNWMRKSNTLNGNEVAGDDEPNASSKTSNKITQYENCLHIVGPTTLNVGGVFGLGKVKWPKHQWNDLHYDETSSDYGPKGYIVEFTPYTKTWDPETKDYTKPAAHPQKALKPSEKLTVYY